MKLRFVLFTFFMVSSVIGGLPARSQPLLPAPPNLETLLKKANGNGKYAMLLLQIPDAKAEGTVGDFADQGMQPDGIIGKTAVPAGFRVYAAPYWFIWRDQRSEKRRWGPEQLTGEPDTIQAGDFPTAWASKTQDEQEEWLLLEYESPFLASMVTIYETHNPGAVNKITAFTLDGTEEEIWAGRDNPPHDTIFINQKNFPRPFKTNRLKIYLDSKNVTGWNEIDAVGVTDKTGKIHWASNAACSSTYADIVTQSIRTGFIPANPNAEF